MVIIALFIVAPNWKSQVHQKKNDSTNHECYGLNVCDPPVG